MASASFDELTGLLRQRGDHSPRLDRLRSEKAMQMEPPATGIGQRQF
jgi:hypothetical protein